MLKITYLEDGTYLEYLEKSVEAWKAERILVNLRAAISVHVESSIASIILPITPKVSSLVRLAQSQPIELAACDEEYLEVNLLGTWIAQESACEEGVFVCELSSELEHYLYRLWQESQVGTSVIG